jgi:hypothetical protein
MLVSYIILYVTKSFIVIIKDYKKHKKMCQQAGGTLSPGYLVRGAIESEFHWIRCVIESGVSIYGSGGPVRVRDVLGPGYLWGWESLYVWVSVRLGRHSSQECH